MSTEKKKKRKERKFKYTSSAYNIYEGDELYSRFFVRLIIY